MASRDTGVLAPGVFDMEGVTGMRFDTDKGDRRFLTPETSICESNAASQISRGWIDAEYSPRPHRGHPLPEGEVSG